MKKAFAFCMAALLFAGISIAEEPVTLNLSFPNQYEGCEWNWYCEDDTLFSDPFTEVSEGDGDGTVLSYSFGAVGTGSTRIYFTCDSPDALAMPASAAVCDVTVDPSGELYVRAARTDTKAGTLTVMLSTNGNVWTFPGDPQGLLILTSELESEDAQVYILQADEPGVTALVFECADLWDPAGGASEEYIVCVSVEADGTIALLTDPEDFEDYEGEASDQ